MKKILAALAYLAGAAFLFLSATALSQAPVEERAAPVPTASEPTADNSLQVLLELQSLREEVSFLRGTIEELEYLIGRLEKQQQENYQDLDNRVRDVYAGVVASPTISPSIQGLPVDNEQLGTVTSSDGSSAANLYEQGFNALRLGERDQAIESFSSLVESYPDASQVADALYWLGETYWLANKREESRQSFVQLLQHSPNYRKAGDAQYRLGVIYDQLGDVQTATEYMQQVADAGGNQSMAANSWLSEHQAVENSLETDSP